MGSEELPAISTLNEWLPSVPAANVPPTLKLPLASVLSQFEISQDAPLLVPRRRMGDWRSPPITLRLQIAPTQYFVESSVSTGDSKCISKTLSPKPAYTLLGS